MFADSKKKSTDKKKAPHGQNRITQDTVITGDIKSEGGFRIEGSVIGNIDAQGKIVVSTSGKVEGDIHCKEADIEGKLVGSLSITTQLILRKTAVIEGDIHTEELTVEPGAKINGKCNMKVALKNINNVQKGEKISGKEQTA